MFHKSILYFLLEFYNISFYIRFMMHLKLIFVYKMK